MKLPCPMCGEADAEIFLSLEDGESLRCEECGDDFDTDKVRNLMARWPAILPWIETHPARKAAAGK